MSEFFKRKLGALPGLSVTLVDPTDSPEFELYERVGEYTYDVLDTVKVNIKRHKFIWKDGSVLSIAEAALRIQESKPTMPLPAIQRCITD